MAKFDKDLMNNAPVKASAVSAMTVIDAVQDMPPHMQLIALTSVFKLMINRFGVPAQDAFTVADNIMNHAQGRRVEFEAVRDYLEGEL